LAEERVQRRLAAILAADVVGYSRLMSVNEESTLRTLKSYREIIDRLIVRHDGRVFSTGGDSVLAEHGSAVEAVRCAIAIQEELRVRNAELVEDRRMHFRIGINVGDVMVEGEDLFGDGVNVAARLEGVAEPDGICIAGSAFDQVKNKLSIGFEDIGLQQVKNIAEPVHSYRVMPEGQQAIAPVRNKVRSHWRVPAIAVAFLVLIGAGGVAWWRPWVSDVKPASFDKTALTLSDKPSIAVLPFTNMSGDKEQKYFVDGMTDDLITRLSKLRGLFVIARNTVFTYKGASVTVKQVAEEIGVRYVLEGSVRRADGVVRVNAQLIDAATGGHLWAEIFDRDDKNVFKLQDEVAMKIVEALAVQLTGTEKKQLNTQRTQNIEAYDLVMRARQFVREKTPGPNSKALALFERAIALDPNYPDAYAGLALTYWLQARFYLGGAKRASRQLPIDLANKSIALGDNPIARCILAAYFLHYRRNQNEALAEARRAAALAPHDVFVLGYLSWVLVYAGKGAEALGVAKEMMRLDPAPPADSYLVYGRAYFANGEFDKAVEAFEMVARLKPQWVIQWRFWLASSYANAGRIDDARSLTSKMGGYNLNIVSAAIREPYLHERDLEPFLDGLRKAGFSE